MALLETALLHLNPEDGQRVEELLKLIEHEFELCRGDEVIYFSLNGSEDCRCGQLLTDRQLEAVERIYARKGWRLAQWSGAPGEGSQLIFRKRRR